MVMSHISIALQSSSLPSNPKSPGTGAPLLSAALRRERFFRNWTYLDFAFPL